MTDFGEVIMTQINNKVTAKYEIRIDSADPLILISDHIVKDAFNHPCDGLFGCIDITEAAYDLFIIINGCNRSLRYKLTKQRPDQHVWEAALVEDDDEVR